MAQIASQFQPAPAVGLPGDAKAVPVEAELGRVPGWRLIALRGVPPIKRVSRGRADQLRRAFLEFNLPKLGISGTEALKRYAAEVGMSFGARLPAYPAAFKPGACVVPTSADLLAAATVLLRVGLLVIEGIDRHNAVTRSRLHISLEGRAFILGEEGDGSRMYWPGGDQSGVTIGPGYDMGGRQVDEIARDLLAIGVPASVALDVGQGAARLQGAPAGDSAERNKNKIILRRDQQVLLFDNVVPRYEYLVCRTLPRSVPPRLFQHEFDALVSVAWNTSHYGHYSLNHDLQNLDFSRAVADWRGLTGGGPGIAARRERETKVFEQAIYMTQPIHPRIPDGTDFPQASVSRGA